MSPTIQKHVRTLYIVLGDQLSLSYPFYKQFDRSSDSIWMAEVEAESTSVWSHKARIVMFLAAMRQFKKRLQEKKFPLIYHQLDKHNHTNLESALKYDLVKYQPEKVVMIEAGDYSAQQQITRATKATNTPLTVMPDTLFICDAPSFNQWAQGKKQLRMEYFYRYMRKTHNILMDKGNPIGDKWNFDSENRSSFGKQGPGATPPWPAFTPDKITKQVIKLVEQYFPNHPGNLEHFDWPVTEEQAHQALDDFIKHRLPAFGAYQDAMWTNEPFLYHSGLSAALNLKLLDPRLVIEQAIESYQKKRAPLAAVEGFVRQILGWREFVRGIYWHYMPTYIRHNALDAQQELPDFYWTADTEMVCLQQVIQQSLDYGYAHHIQRLMVTGLFALLLGVKPKSVHEWYLAIYVDAVEWVELPNTLGMSQYADGGIVASKPYVASGKYIQRMSNYCHNCRYNSAKAVGEDACPFTTLYWDFLQRHKDKFAKHPRTALQWRNLDRLSKQEQKDIRMQANKLREKISG
ncbi:cryptochrome/photolyase family protein [Kaarinaea lacus]